MGNQKSAKTVQTHGSSCDDSGDDEGCTRQEGRGSFLARAKDSVVSLKTLERMGRTHEETIRDRDEETEYVPRIMSPKPKKKGCCFSYCVHCPGKPKNKKKVRFIKKPEVHGPDASTQSVNQSSTLFDT